MAQEFELPELVTVVGWATIAVSFAVMASGFHVCLEMYRKRSTKNVPYILFLSYAFVSALALQYGYLSNNNVLVIINTVSVIVWGAYISVYLLVSKSKTEPFLQLLGLFALHLAHALYLKVVPLEAVIDTMGMYILVWSVVLYVLPITDVFTMVKNQSNESCDILMLMSGILSASVWFLFGKLVNDFYVYFPSYPGFAVCAIKLFLYFYYKKEAKRPVKTYISTQRVEKEVVTDFHQEIYNVKSRENLRHRF